MIKILEGICWYKDARVPGFFALQRPKQPNAGSKRAGPGASKT
jgi:hypothetical protein